MISKSFPIHQSGRSLGEFPARDWKKQYAHSSQDVNRSRYKGLSIVSIRFPPGLCPGMLFRKRRAICQ
jgi:hypothetical protein